MRRGARLRTVAIGLHIAPAGLMKSGGALTQAVGLGWAMLRFQRAGIELATRDETNAQDGAEGAGPGEG